MERDQRTDAEAVSGIRAGDRSAFKVLYFRYAEPLFQFLNRRLKEREIAEDLHQEVFLRLWRRRETLDETKSIKAWLYQTSLNLSVDYYRKTARHPVYTEEEAEIPVNPDETAFEKRDQIRQALSLLSEAQRNVFMLSRFEGLKYHEIAQVLDVSVKTIETHMARALKKLRGRLRHLINCLFIGFLSV